MNSAVFGVIYFNTLQYFSQIVMSVTNYKILEDVPSLTIIREVQKWPVLYSRENKGSKKGYFKRKIWYEVAKSVFSDFDSYTDTEKETKVINLSKRWRNLRDKFKHQVEVEKKAREGKKTRKKMYVYFQHMLFLLPHVTSVKDTNFINSKLAEYLTKEKMKEKNKSDKRKIKQNIGSNTPMNEKKKPEKIIKKKKIEQHFIDESPISITQLNLNTCEADELDEDRHFALSLVPTLKKMSDDEKMIAKTEILKVLRNVKSQSTREKPEDVLYCVEEVDSTGSMKIEYIVEEATEEATNNSGASGSFE